MGRIPQSRERATGLTGTTSREDGVRSQSPVQTPPTDTPVPSKRKPPAISCAQLKNCTPRLVLRSWSLVNQTLLQGLDQHHGGLRDPHYRASPIAVFHRGVGYGI
ncbi:hypothetical protein AAFF_G00286780 [Aldrovandia affinis]|uniref:Uncharacterized protein n=1 Tax=Aldrovandia affinis TaxID=143900 RepID=A0AAD7TAM1_9TELE|nr:hypothetical protein AAFF_G00286780 [Aldrovandia affinis]